MPRPLQRTTSRSPARRLTADPVRRGAGGSPRIASLVLRENWRVEPDLRATANGAKNAACGVAAPRFWRRRALLLSCADARFLAAGELAGEFAWLAWPYPGFDRRIHAGRGGTGHGGLHGCRLELLRFLLHGAAHGLHRGLWRSASHLHALLAHRDAGHDDFGLHRHDPAHRRAGAVPDDYPVAADFRDEAGESGNRQACEPCHHRRLWPHRREAGQGAAFGQNAAGGAGTERKALRRGPRARPSVPGRRRHRRGRAQGRRCRAGAHARDRSAQRRGQCLHHAVGAGTQSVHRGHRPRRDGHDREQADAGRRQPRGAADPYRRRAHRRADPLSRDRAHAQRPRRRRRNWSGRCVGWGSNWK